MNACMFFEGCCDLRCRIVCKFPPVENECPLRLHSLNTLVVFHHRTVQTGHCLPCTICHVRHLIRRSVSAWSPSNRGPHTATVFSEWHRVDNLLHGLVIVGKRPSACPQCGKCRPPGHPNQRTVHIWKRLFEFSVSAAHDNLAAFHAKVNSCSMDAQMTLCICLTS